MATINNFIETLLVLSEKSANIARTCRQDEYLLSLLTQEKQDHEKNPRILHDFKTLVDVLVQQLIKFEIERQYPELKDFVYGEENNTFTNTMGNEIKVRICDNEEINLYILTTALNGKGQAARLLIEQIHSTISIDDVAVDTLPADCPDIPLDQLAIWIDPIDATTEYISGFFENYDNTENAPLKGLCCVAVLIGVFNRETGEPIIGVINQPFYNRTDDAWKGRCLWGLSYQEYKMFSVPIASSYANFANLKVVALSNMEDEETKSKLIKAGFTLFAPSGAGYKLLCVILGIVNAYVLSKGTTYYWDTCACHAILKSLGGVILDHSAAIEDGKLKEITYDQRTSYDIKLYCNNGGIIATKDAACAETIINALK